MKYLDRNEFDSILQNETQAGLGKLWTRDFNMFELPKESRLACPQRVDHCIWALLLDDQRPKKRAQDCNV